MAAPQKLTDEQWEALRVEWSANISPSALSRKYNISRAAISKRADRFNWAKDSLLQEALAANAPPKEARRSTPRNGAAANMAAKAVTIGRVARDRAELVEIHQQAWNTVDELYEDAMRILAGLPTKRLVNPENILGEDGKLLARAEVLTLKKRVDIAAKLVGMYEAASRAFTLRQEGERRAWGFDYKSQLEDNGVDEAAERRRKELIGKLREIGVKLSSPPRPQTIEGERVG